MHLIILILLLYLPLTTWAETYKCPDGKGGEVYRDKLCSVEAEHPASPVDVYRYRAGVPPQPFSPPPPAPVP